MGRADAAHVEAHAWRWCRRRNDNIMITGIILSVVILVLLIHGILRGSTFIRWLCILTLLLLVFGAIVPWPCPGSRERARQVHCMSNLRQIAMATQAYRVDHSNTWPKSFLDLTNDLQNPKVFRCISTGHEPGALANVPEWTDYVFCSPPRENEVLAYCVPEHHKNRGGNIVFADGSVQFLKPEEFADVLKNGRERAPTKSSNATSNTAPSAASEAVQD